jgi:hypothetical protein
MNSTETVFAQLDRLLSGSAIRRDRRARPIAFEMLDDEADVWVFDASREGSLFARGLHAAPALTISCRPELLQQLFSSSGSGVTEGEPLVADGDLDALDVLVDHLTTDLEGSR